MQTLSVKVAEIRQITSVIREFTFVPKAGELPGFSAGSHVVVEVPVGDRRQRNPYSLLGDPRDRSQYRIAVRRLDESRGGSQGMHANVEMGDELELSYPQNLFAPHSLAQHHVLIAGGIGITPFMSYVAELEARGASFELHYAYRGGLTGAFLDDLHERMGEKLRTYDSNAGEQLDIAAVLGKQRLGAHLYTCGPPGLLQAVREQAAVLGWPAGRVHWEEFTAPEPGIPFVVELTRSGRRIEIPGDRSLLETLEDEGVDIDSGCRGGVCGACKTRYTEGEVDHRDHFLTGDERDSYLMPCVSRGCAERPLLLDL